MNDSTMEKMIQELENRKAKILLAAGGADKLEKQHQSGKLSARERIDNLLDPATFVETDMFVHHRCDNFGMEKVEAPDDGVITGLRPDRWAFGLHLLPGFHGPGRVPR